MTCQEPQGGQTAERPTLTIKLAWGGFSLAEALRDKTKEEWKSPRVHSNSACGSFVADVYPLSRPRFACTGVRYSVYRTSAKSRFSNFPLSLSLFKQRRNIRPTTALAYFRPSSESTSEFPAQSSSRQSVMGRQGQTINIEPGLRGEQRDQDQVYLLGLSA